MASKMHNYQNAKIIEVRSNVFVHYIIWAKQYFQKKLTGIRVSQDVTGTNRGEVAPKIFSNCNSAICKHKFRNVKYSIFQRNLSKSPELISLLSLGRHHHQCRCLLKFNFVIFLPYVSSLCYYQQSEHCRNT